VAVTNGPSKKVVISTSIEAVRDRFLPSPQLPPLWFALSAPPVGSRRDWLSAMVARRRVEGRRVGFLLALNQANQSSAVDIRCATLFEKSPEDS
jgi:hypothetical protein